MEKEKDTDKTHCSAYPLQIPFLTVEHWVICTFEALSSGSNVGGWLRFNALKVLISGT